MFTQAAMPVKMRFRDAPPSQTDSPTCLARGPLRQGDGGFRERVARSENTLEAMIDDDRVQQNTSFFAISIADDAGAI
jgi:hypothetical protein